MARWEADSNEAPSEALNRADRALYAAKRAGRNLAIAYSDLPLPGLPPPGGEPAAPGAILH